MFKKKQESRLKSERRKQEKEKRMTGQSYFGFRAATNGEKKTWVQDVLKSERKIGPPCKSEFCLKSKTRYCQKLTDDDRRQIFQQFWQLEWKEKKKFVKTLIDSVPAKRRRLSHKGLTSRKGNSKLYHLIFNSEKVQVCRVTFLNTLGVKEAMIRSWLVKETKPRSPKVPFKSQNVVEYIENLPKMDSKCQFCLNENTNVKYIDLNVKNQFQLYSIYVKDMSEKGVNPASRKTFAKVLSRKNLRIFKPKNERDICDLVKQHNNINFGFQSDKCDGFYYEELDLKILPKHNRISAPEVSQLLKEKKEVYMVDVRADSEFHMCHISGAHNWPVSVLSGAALERLLRCVEESSANVIFLCRRGNDSQLAAKMVLDMLPEEHRHKVKDMIGGLHAWAYDVDNTFPVY